MDRKPQAPRSSTPRFLASLSSLLLLPLLYTPRPITQCGNNNSQTLTPRASAAFSPSLFSCSPKRSLENLKPLQCLWPMCALVTLKKKKKNPYDVNPKDKIVPVFNSDDRSCFLSPLRMAPTEVTQSSLLFVCVDVYTVVMCVGEECASTTCSSGTLGNSKGGLKRGLQVQVKRKGSKSWC